MDKNWSIEKNQLHIAEKHYPDLTDQKPEVVIVLGLIIPVRSLNTLIVKVWIVLFTCLSTRAMHELANTLSTEEFLRYFRRFVARRGRQSIIYSDNGTNFKGKAQIVTNWKEPTDLATSLSRYYSTQDVQWRFIPTHSPWFGRACQRLIGIAKELLGWVVGKILLNLEEFSILLTETETVVNTRPLTYVSEDNLALRPIDFLSTVALPELPEIKEARDSISSAQDNIKNNWTYV
uniref:Integrase catalytic domain-containing protein n=1 Tax=Heterorhabditis bacteriophora TaxID=37862 RepID=A0A1I7XQM6_HETBA